MVMVSPKLNPQACWEFEGDIMVLHHPTTIQTRFPMFFFVADGPEK
jgi:GTPase